MPRNRSTKEGREKSNKYERMFKKTNPGRYVQYTTGAKRKGFEFKITKEQFISLISKSCVYCGSGESIGVDRIDNNSGYILENCASCCTMCNYMKKTFPVDLFLEHCRKITTFNNY